MTTSRLLQRTDTLGRKDWAFPAELLLVIVIGHGLLVPWLGFFWDDWPTAWLDYLQGPGLYWKVFASDRPVLPWLYSLTTPWLGTSPLAWQVFGLLARWVAALCVWWLMRMTWPGRERLAALTALLLCLYPGFKQGPIPIIYSHFFLLYGMTFASFGAMLASVHHPKRRTPLLLLSLVMGSLSIFSVEYTSGLELMRPWLLWVVIGRNGMRGWRRLRAILTIWAPFATVFAAYLVWRVFVLEFPTYQPQLLTGLDANRAEALGGLGGSVVGGLQTATIRAWGQAFALPAPADVGRRVTFGYALVVLVVSGVAYTTLRSRNRAAFAAPEGDEWPSRPLQVVGLGLAAMLAGGLPIWVTQLPVGVDYPWDRLTLPLILGASLVLAGVLELVVHPITLRLGVAAALLGLSAGVHFRSNLTYAREWEGLGSFLWQLSWRVPDLAKGTTVLTNDIPLHYYSDNSLTAPLNWMYSPENHTLEMDYMLYYPTVRVGLALTQPVPDLPIKQAYRAAAFEGSTSQLLALFYNPPGCVHVLDVVLDDSMPNLPRSLSAWVPLSRLDLIQTRASVPRTPPLFADEPAHDWCYYFEKADLARQMGDWRAVADFGDRAFAVDHPNDASERLVFIEGYAHVGRWGRAEELSLQASEQNPAVNRMICNTWERILRQVPADEAAQAAVNRVRERAGCEVP